MTEYLLILRNASANNGYLVSSADMAKDMPLWQAWISRIAQEGKLVNTAPIQYEGKVIHAEGKEQFTPYKEASSVLITGYLICKSDNEDEVTAWAKSCPILQYPSSSVEIRTIAPYQG